MARRAIGADGLCDHTWTHSPSLRLRAPVRDLHLAFPDDVHAAPDLAFADDLLAGLVMLAPDSVWLVHTDVDCVAPEDGPQQPIDEDTDLAVGRLHETQ